MFLVHISLIVKVKDGRRCSIYRGFLFHREQYPVAFCGIVKKRRPFFREIIHGDCFNAFSGPEKVSRKLENLFHSRPILSFQWLPDCHILLIFFCFLRCPLPMRRRRHSKAHFLSSLYNDCSLWLEQTVRLFPLFSSGD